MVYGNCFIYRNYLKKKNIECMRFAYRFFILIFSTCFLYATYIWKSVYKGDIIRLKE